MYVRWKILTCLGIIFWILLCITDFFSDKIPKTDDWLADVSKEEFLAEASMKLDKMQMEDTDLSDGNFKLSWNLLFWNMIAFSSTIFICGVMRKALKDGIKIYHLLKYKKPEVKEVSIEATLIVIPEPKKSSSKIPIPVHPNSAENNLAEKQLKENAEEEDEEEEGITIEKTTSDLTSISAKTTNSNNKLLESERYGKHVERQCAKLREEMLMVQASSIKEHTILSRKLDTVIKEKRELSKQLALAHKENRAAKQQLDELLMEKAMLLKRLENATKEFKVNTKNKKIALVKLDEAHEKIDQLNKQLEQVLNDKKFLEEKAKLLANEYEKMSEPEKDSSSNDFIKIENDNCAECQLSSISPQLLPSYSNDENETSINDNSEVTKDCSSEFLSTENKNQENGGTISQAAIDMKKIQKKIEILEKNLERFRPQGKDGKQECSGNSNENKQKKLPHQQQKESQYKHIFIHKPEKPIENETTERNSNITTTNCSLEHETCTILECLLSDLPTSLKKNVDLKVQSSPSSLTFLDSTTDSQQPIGNSQAVKQIDLLTCYLQRKTPYNNTSEDDSAVTSSKNETCSVSSSAIEYESSSDEWNIKRGIVSKSPAFQQFLQKLEPSSKSSSNSYSLQKVA